MILSLISPYSLMLSFVESNQEVTKIHRWVFQVIFLSVIFFLLALLSQCLDTSDLLPEVCGSISKPENTSNPQIRRQQMVINLSFVVTCERLASCLTLVSLTIPYLRFCLYTGEYGSVKTHIIAHFMQGFPKISWLKMLDINHSQNIWDKVFKNGPSNICGRQPLKNDMVWYRLIKQTISLQIF